MDRDLFKNLTLQSNKYGIYYTISIKYNLFLGNKWDNIKVGEMIIFIGMMARIIMEPINMGDYVSYFWITL